MFKTSLWSRGSASWDKQTRRSRHRKNFRPLVGVLEDRALLSSFPTGSINVAVIGGPTSANGGFLPESGTDLSGITFTNLSATTVNANPTTVLAPFDTVILNVSGTDGMNNNVNNLSPASQSALVSFVGTGHKMVIYNSECPAQNYSWLPYPFTTDFPGQTGLGGSVTIVEENTLSSSNPASPYFINTALLGSQTDAIGDADVFLTFNSNWCLDMTATNQLGDTGAVHTYAEFTSNGTDAGLFIYNGMDVDTMPSSPNTGGTGQLRQVYVQELRQAFNPSNLPCSLAVTGITLTPDGVTDPVGGTHTVTATLTDQLGAPQSGILVTFTILSGPNMGASGVCNPVDCKTDANGQVTFTYTDTGGVGTDTIQATFTNSAGVTIQSAPVTKTWIQTNTAPTVTSPGDQRATEGASQTFNLGTFSDPDGGPWTVDVDWGDTTHTTFTIATDGTNTPITPQDHTYGEEANSYPVHVTVTDSTNLFGSFTFQVAVSDPAVVASGVPDTTVLRGATFTQAVATFTDPGGAEPNPSDLSPLSNHYTVVSIDWGDGTSTGAISYSGSPGSTTDPFTVSGTHAYVANGNYTVTTTIDHEGQISTASSTIHVVPVLIGPGCCVQDALLIGGTPGADTVRVVPNGKQTGASTDTVKVLINGQDLGTWTGFSKIVISGYAGDDDLEVAGSIKHDSCISGGDGNDRVKGGGGNNILQGDAGNDTLLGDNNSRSLMIGGLGSDRLVGNAGDDILIAGTTRWDANDAALCAIMDEWTSGASYSDRVKHLTSGGGLNDPYLLNSSTVFDDGAYDVLTGAAGDDLFFANLTGGSVIDKITDQKPAEVAIDES